jgi:hypothetical protein
MWSVPAASGAFSPLDEELGLLPGSYSPFVHQSIVRLGTIMPFPRVPGELAFQVGVTVSRETARRLTEEAGDALVEAEEAALRAVQRREVPMPEGVAVQQVSADGAMVPLRHGQWAEVRTVAVGTVELRVGTKGPEAHAADVSYFSRLCGAEAFIEWATLPLHQRASERARVLVAIMDGAGWLQDLIDAHRPDAVRILDYAHAAGYLSQAAQAAFGPGSREAAVWLDHWRPQLKTGDPREVLAAIRRLPMPTPEAMKVRAQALGYLTTRLDQIRYAAFRAAGYPIGSGMVESGNKLAVEARLKGAGMHWERANVNPMVALRGVFCGGRWDATWRGIWGRLRERVAERRRRGRERRAERKAAAAVEHPVATPAEKRLPPEPHRVVDGRPTADHPWHQGYDQRALHRARGRATAKS